MELHLKITAGLLLIIHAFHLASLQDPTSSSVHTIDKSWLREVNSTPTSASVHTIDKSWLREVNSTPTSASGRTIDKSWLREVNSTPTSASGRTIDKSWLREVNKKNVDSVLAAAVSSADDENLLSTEGSANDTSDDLNVVNTTLPPTFLNDTTQESEQPDKPFSPNATNPNLTTTNSDQQLNTTETEEESHNSITPPQKPTTPLISGNHTSFPDFDNDTDTKSTIQMPESNATQETITQPEDHTGLTNNTGSTNSPGPTNTTTTTEKTPEINKTLTTSLPTAVFPVEPTVKDPATTTAAALDTPEKVTKMDKGAASGSSSERGLASGPKSGRNVQWGAVLGTAVVVAIVGLVAYFIMRKKQQKAFSHQKLVEEYHADPVLRLDNSEPLDLNFGGVAYYNPGLQGDNIQMTNFPGRHNN